MNLSNKSAIITGAGSGMGAATARFFAKKGVKLALLDMQTDKVEEVAEEVGGLAFTCDVRDETQVRNALLSAKEQHGTAHILVNCAGICPGSRVVGREAPHDLQLFTDTVGVNLVGSFNTLRLAAADMMEEEPIDGTDERGVIINTASVAAYDGQIGQAAYAASKGGIVSMTLPIAREFSKFGIRIMTIAPGLMETPMLAGMTDEVRESLIATTLYPKRLGKPEEFAELVGHICENQMLNGETIRLDGAIRLAPK